MFLVRAQRVKRTNADNCTEDIGLFKVKIDPFRGLVFDELDCALDMGDS